MTIDSYRAAKVQLANEARAEQYPGLQIVIGVARKAAGLGGFELSKFEDLAWDAIQRNTRDNVAYLLEALVQDVERVDLKLDAFESAGNTETRALNELVSEAVARVAEAKTKERVRRVARILARALQAGPKQNYELERELINTAVQIAESDASALGVIMKYQSRIVGGAGVADVNAANQTWRTIRDENKEFRDPHIHVSCARLQAQGLIIRMDRIPTSLDLTTNAYSLTEFGIRFCEWCLQEAGK
jgi:hypothetical protein